MSGMSRLAVFGVLLAGVTALASTNSTINSTRKWAWSSSVGWINCKSDATNGMIVGQYVCSGFMYSPTAGWISLGKFALPKGKQTTVTLSNKDTDGYVIADGVQFLPVK